MQAAALAAVHLRQHFHGPHVDYAGVAVGAFISWVGISGPGEAALIAAGIVAAKGKVDLTGILVVAWAGATLGGIAGWGIGRAGGRALIERPGPFLATRQRMLASGDRFYERWGALAVYFAPTWMAGINGMAARRFLIANVISAVIWALPLGIGAYLIGPSITEYVSDLGTFGLLGLIVLVIGALVVRRRRRAR